LLSGAFGEDEAGRVTVVFDAAHAPPDADAVLEIHGIQVYFAVGEHEADDLIEKLIRSASAPKQLTVVSDDHRLQDAARRRRCAVLGCGDFVDWLDRHRRQRKQPSGAEMPSKPEGVSLSETQHWLSEFADLENDPEFKEAFNPFDFGEDQL
jgi:predicted RNA-binding protein with PIN domain